MSIWFSDNVDIETSKIANKNTIVSCLGIEFIELGNDFLKAKMPVNENTVQPFRVLHGGASVVLAETLGSFASFLVIDSTKYFSVGQSINANHIKSAKEGEWVIGKATPIHLGKSSHVWHIEIRNQIEELICVSRLTMAVLPIK